MNYVSRLTCILFCCIALSCSKDAEDNQNQEEKSLPDFIALGQDATQMQLYSFNAASSQGTLSNLTQKSGIAPEFITLRQFNELLTFYTFMDDKFSAVQENVVTGESTSIQDFYTTTPERSIIWGANTDTNIFLAFYSPDGSSNLNIRSIDIATQAVVELFIENDVGDTYQPLVFENRLFVTYKSSLGSYRVAVLDTDTLTILENFDFGDSRSSILINELGDLVVIKSKTGFDNSYIIYDFETLEPKDEQIFVLNRFFAPGPLEAQFANNKLYYTNLFAQPSEVAFSPAIFDFDKAENNIVDVFGIIREIETEIGNSIKLISLRFDQDSSTFLLGYQKVVLDDTLTGGILIITTENELLEHIEVPFVPTYFVKR